MTEFRICGIDPDRDLERLDERLSLLPVWRRRHALSFQNPVDRLQSAVAFELLAGLLNEIYGVAETGFMLGYDDCGKPFIDGEPLICVSLSHCPHGAMALVSDVPAGCDIERIVRPYDGTQQLVVDYAFCPAEKLLIDGAADKAFEFARLWTLKEAMYKRDNRLDLESIDTTETRGLNVATHTIGDCVASVVW